MPSRPALTEVTPGACAGPASPRSPVAARVPTAALVAKLNGFQSEGRHGPCITALREHRTVRIDDMAGAKTELQFDHAPASRDIIGQAKGIVMERCSVDDTCGFAMLIELSKKATSN